MRTMKAIQQDLETLKKNLFRANSPVARLRAIEREFTTLSPQLQQLLADRTNGLNALKSKEIALRSQLKNREVVLEKYQDHLKVIELQIAAQGGHSSAQFNLINHEKEQKEAIERIEKEIGTISIEIEKISVIKNDVLQHEIDLKLTPSITKQIKDLKEDLRKLINVVPSGSQSSLILFSLAGGVTLALLGFLLGRYYVFQPAVPATVPTSQSAQKTNVAVAVAQTLTALPTISVPTAYGSTLKQIKLRNENKGELRCGINGELDGFSRGSGNNSVGLDAAYCRALAIAINIDPGNIRFIPLNSEERFPSLFLPESAEKKTDVIFRNTSKTAVNDIFRRVRSGPTYYYDEQGILGKAMKDTNGTPITNTSQLDSSDLQATICVIPDTTTYDNLISRFHNNKNIVLRTKPNNQDDRIFNSKSLYDVFFEGKTCDFVSSDIVQLLIKLNEYDLRGIGNYTFLVPIGQKLSTEFYSPYVAGGDQQWLDIVTWVTYAPMQASEVGIARADIQDGKTNKEICDELDDTQKIIMCDNPIFQSFGLSPATIINIVRSEGNYKDMYTENLLEILSSVRSNFDKAIKKQFDTWKDLSKTKVERDNAEAELYNLVAGPNKLASKGGHLAPPQIGTPPTPTPALSPTPTLPPTPTS